MQIENLPICLCSYKNNTLRILELFTGEVWKFLSKQTNFYLILLFQGVGKETFPISHVRIPQNVKDFF